MGDTEVKLKLKRQEEDCGDYGKGDGKMNEHGASANDRGQKPKKKPDSPKTLYNFWSDFKKTVSKCESASILQKRARNSPLNHDFTCSRLYVLYLSTAQSNFRLPRWLSVSKPFDFPKEEEKVIRFWREIDAFKTSLKLSEGRPEYTFYDGPPFATGLPHYGHLLAGTIKVRTQHDRGKRLRVH